MQPHYSRRPRTIFWTTLFIGLLLSSCQIFSSTSESPADLIINEFLAVNQTGLADEDGDYSDWIEIYNQGHQAVNLASWSLTDDPDQPEKWLFPNITLDSKAYLVVFASGKDRRPTQPGSELHTNFKLNRRGEFLGLYNVSRSHFANVPRPSVENGFSKQFEDISYGRPDNQQSESGHRVTYGYLTTPTPGKPNNQALLWAGLVIPPNFSIERGFYDAPFTLELGTTTADATIRYTTDGSEPTETDGTIYTGPIAINTTTLLRAVAFKPKFKPSPVDTHTYIFLDDVLIQPADPPGFPSTWGGYEGSPVRADYEMDPEVVNDPRYSSVVKESLESIPTLSIVTDLQNFHDLYANPGRRGRAWERPASIEFIDPQSNGQGFQVNAGLRIQGDLGRSESIPKHSFRVFFRGDYGATKLEYPLFPNSPVEEFDTLTLRAGVNRSYAGYQDNKDEIKLTTYTRDEWLRASQIAMSDSGSHGIFVHLYLNGLYWGLYNMVERPDEAFMSSHFGGSKDDWQTISHAETTSNSSERFKTLHKLAAEGQLEEPERYAAIQAYLDIPHFIDYLILNWYAGNLDWGFNNWYAGVQSSSGQVRYFAWDGERTWFEGAEIYMEFDEYNNQPNLVKPLLEALLENPEFKMELADRMHKHLSNNGALTETNARARWENLNGLIEQAIIGESARWGDARFDTPLTQADWFKARDDVTAQMEGNAAKLINLAREAGYYPAIDPPLFEPQRDEFSNGLTIIMTSPVSEEGIIYYSTDGSDPRLQVTGVVAPTAMAYSTPLNLTTTTQIKARVLDGNMWSALQEAIFKVVE